MGDSIKVGRQYLGGAGCSKQIDGRTCVCKTQGAYPDIPIVTELGVIVIEVDENAHRYYELDCELARYDTLMYGSDDLRPTTAIRFNP